MIRRYGDTDFITGLRAIAALMVIMVHTAAFGDFGALGETISGAGRYGVDVFFVISGFTIAATFQSAPNYRAYLTRRLYRIAPLYWAVVLVAFGIALAKADAIATLWNLGLHLVFLSYLDGRIANSLPGGEWTIPVEVFWYALLPLILPRLGTWARLLGWTLGMLVLAAAFKAGAKALFDTSLPAFWLPVSHATGFLMGAFAFGLRPRLAALTEGKRRGLVALAWGMFALGLIQNNAQGELFTLATFTLLIAVHGGITQSALSLTPMLFLGSISYSLYLIHLLVIFAMQALSMPHPTGLSGFALLTGATIVISILTYLTIERPTNRLGARRAQKQA